MDIDGERWFDAREQEIYEVKPLPPNCKNPLCLPSDSRQRADLVELYEENVEGAQANKEAIEEL